MKNLEKDFPLIKYVVTNEIPEYDPEDNSTVIQKNVQQLEDCAICQD